MASQTAVLRFCIQNLSLKKLPIRSLSSQSQAPPPKSPKKSKSQKEPTTASTSPAQAVNTSSYVSAATPKPPTEPVGPGASKTSDYKNPEYFCYNELSYYDLEREMMKDRLPQPKSGSELL